MPAPKLADQIARTAARLAQLKNRELATRQREKAKAKEDARKADAHKKITLGGLVIASGLAEWDPAELVGLLLDGSDRAASPTIRMGFRKRGLDHLEARAAARQP